LKIINKGRHRIRPQVGMKLRVRSVHQPRHPLE
jgi:hypothetical protein